MKPTLFTLIIGAVLLLAAGCSTPESRIRGEKAAFNGWPADVQEKIRAGHIDLGFTPAMVLVALGEADRTYHRLTDKGTAEVWVYLDHGPRFTAGVGVAVSNGPTASGGGVAVGDDVFREDEVLRVIFEHGHVAAVEMRRR